MNPCRIEALIARRYRDVFGATVRPVFSDYPGEPIEPGSGARSPTISADRAK